MAKTKKDIELPSRNPLYETILSVGAAGLILYYIGIVIFAIVAIAFNDTGNPNTPVIANLALYGGISLVIQAILVLKEWRRVDRYHQRIAAIECILIFPFLILIGLFSHSPAIIGNNYLLISAAIASVAGSIWLWFLLLKKDKLVWILEGNPRTKDYKRQREKLLKSRRVGIWLIVAPILLFVFCILLTLNAGSSGSLSLQKVANLLFLFVFVAGLPGAMAGAFILARNR